MSRMRLRKSTRVGEYEVYPIYELDYNAISAMGIVTEETNDNVGSKVNKYRQWRSINNNLVTAMSLNIPKSEVAQGNIIPFWHRFNNIVSGRYTFDQDVLSSFAAVEQGVRPDDWGVNPNYVQLVNETREGHNITFAYPINKTDSWSGSTSYYEDTKRTQLRMFYTDDGYSFSVSKATDYVNARGYIAGHFISWTSSSPGYDYTDENNETYNRSYKISRDVSITNASAHPAGWEYWEQGYNCPMIFVHYNDGTTDFYGIALVQMSDFTENAYPVAIVVSAFDSKWWGTSVIAGSGGEGQWTNDGPPAYVQGGQGSFQAPSDNHGDADGTSTGAIADSWSAKGMAYSEGYNKYLVPLRETSPGVYKAPAFKEMVHNLTDPGVLQGFKNLMYNPISAVITCALIPRSFAPTTVGVDYIHAAGLDLTSENAAAMYEQTYKRVHIGSVNINSFTDSFADFDNTAVYIHLPYVGNFQLDTAAVMEGELSVDYLIDYFTNDITAIVWTRDKFGNYNYRYEWKGNCGKPMPLTQINTMSSKLAASMIPVATGLGVGAIAGTVSGLATGGAAAAITAKTASTLKSYGMSTGNIIKNVGGAALHNFGAGFKQGFGSTMGSFVGQQSLVGTAVSAAQALTSGQSILSSNANGGSVSSPVNTQCYLAIVRPMWSAPEDYAKLFGYPSDISGTINHSDTEVGDPFTNFLSVRAILLDGLTCLPEEKVEIESLMKAGVYVSND
jgi:hypothetical protein